MTSQSPRESNEQGATARQSLPEFDDLRDEPDGTMSARHKPSGTRVTGERVTRDGDRLENRAAAKRIGWTLRQAAKERKA